MIVLLVAATAALLAVFCLLLGGLLEALVLLATPAHMRPSPPKALRGTGNPFVAQKEEKT